MLSANKKGRPNDDHLAEGEAQLFFQRDRRDHEVKIPAQRPIIVDPVKGVSITCQYLGNVRTGPNSAQFCTYQTGPDISSDPPRIATWTDSFLPLPSCSQAHQTLAPRKGTACPIPRKLASFRWRCNRQMTIGPNSVPVVTLPSHLQEQEQTGEATETLSALFGRLQSDNPDPAKAHQALHFAVRTLSFDADYRLGNQPQSDQWLRDTLTALSRQAALPAEDYSGLEPTALKAEIRARIAATPADGLTKFSRLETLRGPEVVRIDMRIIGLPLDLDRGHARLLKGLLTKGALRGAKGAIDSWTDTRQRASGYAALALAYARAGEIDRATTLALSPELGDLTRLDYTAKFGLIEVWARAGVLNTNEILPDIRELSELAPELDPALEARITIAMVTGDIPTAHDLLATIEHWRRGVALDEAIDAALKHDPARGGVLVTLFPREEQAEVLYSLGRAQIRIGDVQGASATIAQLERLPDPIHSVHMLRGLLAPVLAAMGRETEAVRLAVELDDATVTALVAARLR